MRYSRFKNEEGLLKALSKSKGAYNVYPKVTTIAGQRVRPDIDLLEIHRESENQYNTIGYECKLMRFDHRGKTLSWEGFYKGIGQALLYLKNGVQRTVLIVGFYENVPEDKLIEAFKAKLYDDKSVLQDILGPYLSIALLLYEGGTPFLILESRSYYYHSDNEARLCFDSLLQRKFRYNEKYLLDAKQPANTKRNYGGQVAG